MLSPHVSGLGPAVLATTWSEFAAGTVLMSMRIYVNAFIIRRWSADFWWALITYICSVLATIFLTISVEFGLGSHLTDLLALDSELIVRNQFHQWIFTTFAIVSIALGKLAIIALILQIEGTSTTAHKRKWVLWAFVASNVIVNIIIIPIVWTQCSPTAKMWDNSLEGDCNGRERNKLYGFFQGSFGAFLDVALAIYPVIIFWNLKLRLHIKIGLMVLFGFGIMASVCAVVKTVELSTLTATSDLTFELANLNIWASTEMWVVFIVGCIPTTRPLFVKVLDVVVSSGNRTFRTGRGYTEQDNSNTNTSRSRAYSESRKNPSKITTIVSKNESEENILPGQEGIMMTRDIRVQYQRNDPEAGSFDKASKDPDNWKTRFDDQV
ncbi:uncharacterized protein LY89DRAFT_723577 [Mollisia scopiformis]|uniref:Rhodopsin domain-containing protein n=1 Tax=Mollisia scopiformis TaxID=149040 RepID=A0A132BD26_MOLSC|nr:uncharacterized protein LY89DRAFT_723577 [Mollisia scopiformis]KUJ10332.1 hypothetical protein LY89DRAFT_723577 [Mollisia scopiformis]